jgi:hypothetical protein
MLRNSAYIGRFSKDQRVQLIVRLARRLPDIDFS